MGSILGGKQKASSASSNKVVVPNWLDKQNQNIASRAEVLSNKAYTPYTGQRVADFSGDTNTAFSMNRGNVGKYTPLLDNASSGVMQLMQRVNGPSSTDITALMNPYIQNVLDTQRRKATEVAGEDQAALKRQAALSGSFGGSRFGVQQQKQSQDLSNQMNDIEYQGLSDAFMNAMNQWNTGTNTLSQGIGQSLQTATQGQQYDTNDIANLLKAGALQEDKSQQGLDVKYADWDTEQAYPFEQVSWLSNILNPLTGAYAGTESTGSQTTKSGGGIGQAIGTAASVASLFGFSDERIKENIEEVGELDNGLKIYKYNFIGNPKTEIGLLAQEVEKDNPEAVAETAEGIKMVNYDKATKEDKYASGGVVTSPQLLEALRQKTVSAGSPHFTGAPAIQKPDSSNPILDMLGKGGDMFGSSGKKGIMDLFGGSSYSKDVYGVGGDLGGTLDGLFASSGVRYADGGFVDNPYQKAPYHLAKLMEYNNAGWKQMGQQAEPSPDDSHAKLLLKKVLGVAPGLKNWADQELTELSNDTKNNYNDFFIRPASEVDAERGASLKDRSSLMEGLKDKASAEEPDLNNLTPITKGDKGMPMPHLDPATGDPRGIGLGMGDRKAPNEVIPPIREKDLGTDPMKGEGDILQLLKQYLIPPAKKEETKQEKRGGVNMPLLMAGLAMMSSKGDTATALAEGAGAFMMTKGNAKKAAQEEELLADEQKQKKIKNLLDYMKIRAYLQQVQGKTAGITPYQQAMLAFKERGLDIQQQKANQQGDAAKGIMNLFGNNQPLTPQDDNVNLEMLLEAFAAQDGKTPQVSLEDLE